MCCIYLYFVHSFLQENLNILRGSDASWPVEGKGKRKTLLQKCSTGRQCPPQTIDVFIVYKYL